LALSETSKRPDSASAQYNRAAALVSAGTLNGRPLVEDALVVLQDNEKLPGASILYETALIVLNSQMHRPVDAAWWDNLFDKLKSRPPSVGDATSLDNLNGCFIEKLCTDDVRLLDKAYAIAMTYPSPSAYLLSAYAEFAWHLKGNLDLAEQEFRLAVSKAPLDSQARRSLVNLLIATGQFAQARTEIEAIRKLDFLGMYHNLLAELTGSLRAAMDKPATPSESSSDADSEGPKAAKKAAP
jgi:hypothetical protein